MHDVTRPQVPARPPPPKPRSGKKIILLAGALLAVVVVAWWMARRGQSAGPAAGAAAGARGQMPPVPVVEAVVASRDVPIYLDGLGTVQAFNSVTVRSRVDGQLVQVALPGRARSGAGQEGAG
jgi:multidrug efflux system membrane fusion protein